MSALPKLLSSLVTLAWFDELIDKIRREKNIDRAGGLVVEDVNLASLTAAAPSKTIERGCLGLYYSPRGSAAGGLLVLDVGGQLRDFGPGDKITGPIEKFAVSRHLASAPSGNARLVLLSSAWVDYTSLETDPALAAPVDLLGTSGNVPGSTQAFITVAENTDPAGLNPTGSFDVSGWKKIRVLIDTASAAANATSFDLVPWFSPNSNTQWFEQGTERISVPDTDTTGGQYRVLVLNVSGRGQMYFAVRNLLAAARTGLGFIVQGIA